MTTHPTAQQELKNLATWLMHMHVGTAALPAGDTLKRWALQVDALASPPPATAQQRPEVLFDGNAVYAALAEKAKARTSPDNVSDVLDAVVKLLRASPPPAAQPDCTAQQLREALTRLVSLYQGQAQICPIARANDQPTSEYEINAWRWASEALAPPSAREGQAGAEPFAYWVYIPAQQRGEFVHDLDDAVDDLTNCECEVTKLFAHPAPVAQQPASAWQTDELPPVPEPTRFAQWTGGYEYAYTSDQLRDYASDAFERGRQLGMTQERALWKLAKDGQELEQPLPAEAMVEECHEAVKAFVDLVANNEDYEIGEYRRLSKQHSERVIFAINSLAALAADAERLRKDAERWREHQENIRLSCMDETMTIRLTIRTAAEVWANECVIELEDAENHPDFVHWKFGLLRKNLDAAIASKGGGNA